MLNSIILALPLLGAVSALPTLHRREVPQEHAHQNVLDIIDPLVAKNNPDNIGSSVFGLLGAAAAIKGAGNIADADCLQQATADQAFTNAKAAGDVNGQTFALIYRALERNTGSVGLASVPCASIKAVNPEIAALQQHQDPASSGAAALNKQIATTLATQIASIGGNVTLANEASTFAPGTIGDSTAKGNTCDTADDKAGCINSQNLRVDDLSAAEVTAASSGSAGAAAGAGAGTASGNTGAAGNATASAGNAKAGKGNANQGAAASQAGNGAAASQGGTGAAATQAGNGAAASQGGTGAAATQAGNGAAASQGGTGAAATQAAGACDLSVTFTSTPADGRNAPSFEATDLTKFPHGSALAIGVISDFICQQAVSKCNLSAASAATCTAASTTAKTLKAQAAADSFNAAVAGL